MSQELLYFVFVEMPSIESVGNLHLLLFDFSKVFYHVYSLYLFLYLFLLLHKDEIKSSKYC